MATYQEEVDADKLGFKLYQKALQGKNPYISQQTTIVQKYYYYYQNKDESKRLADLERARQETYNSLSPSFSAQEKEQVFQERQKQEANRKLQQDRLKYLSSSFNQSERQSIIDYQNNPRPSSTPNTFQNSLISNRTALNLGSYSEIVSSGSKGSFTGAVNVGGGYMQDYYIEYDKGSVTSYKALGQKQRIGKTQPILSLSSIDYEKESLKFYDLFNKGDILGTSTRFLDEKQYAKAKLLTKVNSSIQKQSIKTPDQYGTYFTGTTTEAKDVIKNLTPERTGFSESIPEPYYQTQSYENQSTLKKISEIVKERQTTTSAYDLIFSETPTEQRLREIKQGKRKFDFSLLDVPGILEDTSTTSLRKKFSQGSYSNVKQSILKTIKIPDLKTNIDILRFRRDVSSGVVLYPVELTTTESVKFLVNQGIISPVATSTGYSMSTPLSNAGKNKALSESLSFTKIGDVADDTMTEPILNLPSSFRGGSYALDTPRLNIYNGDYDIISQSEEIVSSKKKTSKGLGLQNQYNIDSKSITTSRLTSQAKKAGVREELLAVVDVNDNSYYEIYGQYTNDKIINIKTLNEPVKTTGKYLPSATKTNSNLIVTKIGKSEFPLPEGVLYKITGQVKSSGSVVNTNVIYLRSTIPKDAGFGYDITSFYNTASSSSTQKYIQSVLSSQGSKVSSKTAQVVLSESRVNTIVLPELKLDSVAKVNLPVSISKQTKPQTSTPKTLTSQNLILSTSSAIKQDTILKTEPISKTDTTIKSSSSSRSLSKLLSQQLTLPEQKTDTSEKLISDTIVIQRPIQQTRQRLINERVYADFISSRVSTPIVKLNMGNIYPIKFKLKSSTSKKSKVKKKSKRRDNINISEGFTEKILGFKRKIKRKNLLKEALSEGNIFKIRGKPIIK